VKCLVRIISNEWHPDKTMKFPVIEQDELEVKLKVLNSLKYRLSEGGIRP
ncbi:hypothetical protein MKX03_009608, partial [Papaver bracteatum]